MCYRGCCWEDRDGECRCRRGTPPCERDNDPYDDGREEEPSRNPDSLYDSWREARDE